MSKKSTLISKEGIACPRCGTTTEVRGHIAVTDKQRRQPFYYSRWFNCPNAACPTTLIMRDEFKIINDPEKAAVAKRTAAIQEQLQDTPRAISREFYKGDVPPWE